MQECLEDAAEVEDKIDFQLMDHQKEALQFLGNGKILFGSVGSGKSATALAYYMKNEQPKDIYVITTAKKRDSLEWLGEAAKFGIGPTPDTSVTGLITIDSWNNLGNYLGVRDAFFIFDEQRLVGHGAWVKMFLRIVQHNWWIMLTATPGDVWMDYAPVFIANGWYRNITDFRHQHVVLAPYIKFPKIIRYLGTDKLNRLRNEILVEMPYVMHTQKFVNYMDVEYDKELYDRAVKERWHVYEDRPIKDMGELFRVMRKIVNTDPSRLEMVRWLLQAHPKLIIFYNFDYELEILRTLCVDADVGEWNGHRKHPIPDTDKWVYLVQYASGAESWNCTQTNAMVLYSLTYSYKNHIQSQGRIDRLDTDFEKLYYYLLVTSSSICRAVRRSLDNKKNFNERHFMAKI